MSERELGRVVAGNIVSINVFEIRTVLLTGDSIQRDLWQPHQFQPSTPQTRPTYHSRDSALVILDNRLDRDTQWTLCDDFYVGKLQRVCGLQMMDLDIWTLISFPSAAEGGYNIPQASQ